MRLENIEQAMEEDFGLKTELDNSILENKKRKIPTRRKPKRNKSNPKKVLD